MSSAGPPIRTPDTKIRPGLGRGWATRSIQQGAAWCSARKGGPDILLTAISQRFVVRRFVGRVERSAPRHSFAGTTAGYAPLTRPTRYNEGASPIPHP